MNRDLIAAKVQLQKLTKEIKEENKRLEKLVHLDSLTEVFNHGHFQSFLKRKLTWQPAKTQLSA